MYVQSCFCEKYQKCVPKTAVFWLNSITLKVTRKITFFLLFSIINHLPGHIYQYI